MSNSRFYSRRKFLQQTGLGLISLSAFPQWLTAAETMHGMTMKPPRKATPGFKPDVEFDLYCQNSEVQVLAGAKTKVQRYTAKLISGPEHTISDLPNSYLGPVIRLQQGQKVRVNLFNQLDEETITHWHGLHVPSEVDGHPMYAFGPGQKFVYEMEIVNRASMIIYHPHPHEATAKQVYHGLAGGIIINDQEEAALELPGGEYEIPIVIQDKLFDTNNQLLYSLNMHDSMFGFYGNRILVNGHPEKQLELSSRAYRLRFLNGSTARIYKLAWDDGTPITVIGTDGGLLEEPEHKPYVMLAPGERLDVWADFSGRPVGSGLVMRSLPYSGVVPMMGRGMMGGGHGLPVGSDYAVFTVRINKKVSDSPKLPTKLAKVPLYKIDDTANPNKPVPITISEGHMQMLLNGRPYAFNDIQDNERIKVNTIQLMEISHDRAGHGMGMMGGMRHDNSEVADSGETMQGGMGMGRMGRGMGMGGMMSMAHPIHLHGQPYQIISRSVDAGRAEHYGTVNQGFVNSGLKDTVLVMPGETVRIIKPFQDFKGLFMFHCHNLEHEDMGMMRDFSVE